MKYIPDITDGNISMPAIEFRNSIMTKGFIDTQIWRPFRRAMFLQMLKLFFSLDVLLNPAVVKANIFRQLNKLSNGRLASIAALGASPVLQIGCNVVNNVSKLLQLISGGESQISCITGINQTAGEVALEGIEGLGGRIVEGADSVLFKTLQQAKNEGLIGIFAGFGEGFVDFVTKPVLGLFDASVGLMFGAKKAIDGDDMIYRRVRIARAFPLKIIKHIDPFCWKLQNVVQMSSVSLKTHLETTEIVFNEVNSRRWVWIGQHFLVVVDGDLNIVGFLCLKDVKCVVCEGKRVELNFAGNVCQFLTSDAEIASRVARYTVFRGNCLSIGE
jgi:hypothetical protein